MFSVVPCVFLFTGTNKTLDFRKFIKIIERSPYNALNDKYNLVLGIIIILNELLSPFIFILYKSKIGLFHASLTIIFYTAFLCLLKVRKVKIDCGCFGVVKSSKLRTDYHGINIARNFGLLLILSILYVISGNSFSREEIVNGIITWFPFVLVSICIVNTINNQSILNR